VAAQMDALQINDWPEPDAGVHTAVSGSVAGEGCKHTQPAVRAFPVVQQRSCNASAACLRAFGLPWSCRSTQRSKLAPAACMWPLAVGACSPGLTEKQLSCARTRHPTRNACVLTVAIPRPLRPAARCCTLAQLAFAKPYQCEDLVAAAPLQGGVDASPVLPLPTPRFTRRGSSSSKTGSGGSSSNGGSSSSSSAGSSDGSSSGSRQTLVRSWSAREAWLTPQEFAAELHSSTYAPLLGCDSWRACSTMVSKERVGGWTGLVAHCFLA
jgi:uncharacterized membrane protein YgcG